MGDVDDVEHAERDRHADRDGGVEAAEQQAGHHGVAEEVEGHFHYAGQCGQCAESWLARFGCNISAGWPPTRPEWSGQAGGLASVQRMKPSSSFFAQAMTSLIDWPECTLASIVG